VKNQFGQEIEIGDFVGYVNRTGSYTERKVGVITGFGSRERGYGSVSETTAHVTWVWDGSYGLAAENKHKGTVGVRRVFKLDPASLYPYVAEALQQAGGEAK
jgi:hypothetical protein